MLTAEWADIFGRLKRVRVPLMVVERIDFKNDLEEAATMDEELSVIVPHYADNEEILEKQFLDLKTIDARSVVVYQFDKIINMVDAELTKLTTRNS